MTLLREVESQLNSSANARPFKRRGAFIGGGKKEKGGQSEEVDMLNQLPRQATDLPVLPVLRRQLSGLSDRDSSADCSGGSHDQPV